MIPFQENVGGLVCLLPDGRVEFLHLAARPLLETINQGGLIAEHVDFDEYILQDPFVDLDRFHLSSPAIAFIEVTNLCNLRCKHCYANSAYKRPNELSTELVLALIDELGVMGVLQVFLTGGEIFAHPDAVRIIEHARSKPFSTQIFTNGLLMTEEKLARIPAGTSFFISFDTADPVRTVRGKMDFPTLRERFEWLTRHGHVYRTAISVHRNNIHDTEEIFEWCAVNGFPRPQWIETYPIGRALLHPDILLRPEQVEEVFEVYKRCMERYSAPPVEEGRESPEDLSACLRSIDTIKFCQRLERATGQEKCGRTTAYIDSAGNVYPCSNCMSNKAYSAGSLREHAFREIWEHGFDEFRQITFDHFAECSRCPVNQAGVWCQFRCPPLAANVSGDSLGCGATEYIRRFMLLTHQYWEERRIRKIRLTLEPTARY